MSAATQEPAASAYPPPPAFYVLYAGVDRSGQPLTPPPPPKPVKGAYTTFGISAHSDVSVPPLQGANLLQTSSDGIDHKQELRRLNGKLLRVLFELMDALEKTPSESARELESVVAVQNNMMHLCNLLRPIQARATLRHILKSQAEQKELLIKELRNQSSRVDDAVLHAYHSLLDAKAAGTGEEIEEPLKASKGSPPQTTGF